MHKFLAVTFIVVGVLCIGVSVHAGQALIDSYVDMHGYVSDVIRAVGAQSTLPTAPQGRFLGTGYLGEYAPTFFAIVGTICFFVGYRGLSLAPERAEG